MTTRGVLDFHCQYPTVQEAMGAGVWLDTWQSIHYANVRPSGTTHQAIAVIPPTPPPDPPDTAEVANQYAYGQLNFTMHLEAADKDTLDVLAREVITAITTIIAEGGSFNCIGDSGGSYDYE